MKTRTVKLHTKAKAKTSRDMQKLIPKRKLTTEKIPLTTDPFFSSPAIDIGHTNNDIIDEILYGKKCK